MRAHWLTKPALTNQMKVSRVLCHMKREFKPCVYCNTVTNDSFRFSHLEILLNMQKGKSNVQVDPSRHCLLTTERPFSRHTIYIRLQVSKGAPKQVYTVESLKQNWNDVGPTLRRS